MKVIISNQVASDLISLCVDEYKDAVSRHHAPRQWAVLVGKQHDADIEVSTVYHASENLRDEDPVLIAEYDGPRASTFGGVYKDLRRGYQSEGGDLMDIWRKAEVLGLDVLGSVHMHADLHNLDRPDELSPITTHMATQIDHDLFKASAWPLNMIVYVEQTRCQLCWAMTAWVPSYEEPAGQANYREAPVLIRCEQSTSTSAMARPGLCQAA